MSKFEVKGKNYSSSPLDVFIQFHITRRLAPIIGSLVMLRSAMLRPEDMMPSLVEGLQKMSDTDSEYIIHNCLAVTQREIEGGNGWGPIFSASSKRMMYADVDMLVMLMITWNVLQDNLGDFMPVPSPNDGTGGTDQPSPK